MTYKPPTPPLRTEIERELFKILDEGDETTIAGHMRVDQSLIARKFNPRYGDRKSWSGLYRAIDEHYGCCGASVRKGDAYALLFNRFAQRNRLIFAPNGKVDLKVQTATTRKSVFELLAALTEEIPYSERMQFLENAEGEIKKLKDSLTSLDIEDSPAEEFETSGRVS